MPQDSPENMVFTPDEDFAAHLDARDPIASYRRRFHIPTRADGRPLIYFCGHSLGLMPIDVRDAVDQELRDWAELGVDAHFRGRTPWYSYHQTVRDAGARLVGARPREVVFMNGLTVNLHLLMVGFYRPTRDRFKIVMEDAAFPSDTYAVRTQIRYHGYDPNDALIVVRPRSDRQAGPSMILTEDIEALLRREGEHIALVLLGGVNYFTGQYFEIERITRAARAAGCYVGFDLAHAAGNVPLALHDWGVDFAVWCTYKYLNSGPGAVAGCFVHERHLDDDALPRFGGWWGNDPATRFRMHLNDEFIPVRSADAWQLSNPPILSLAPVRTSLAIFDEIGMTALREKSLKLTGYLAYHLERICGNARDGEAPLEVLTPSDPARRGCQLSIVMRRGAKDLLLRLHDEGVVCDFREPNVLRVAPVPLYNTFHEVWRFARAMERIVRNADS